MRSQSSPVPQPLPTQEQVTTTSAQPVVLVVNPNPGIDPSQQCITGRPYLNRGAQLSNGCRCLFPHMVILCVVGGLMLFFGLINSLVGLHTAATFMVPGGILLFLGIYFMFIAKKQFNSLPPDHPDRAKYAVRNINHGHVSGPTVYALPPMQNQVITDPSLTGGQVYYNTSVPPGSAIPVPGLEGVQFHYAVPVTQGYHPYAPPGRNTAPNHPVPESDPPPPYSDVVYNI